jgi:hypothetical protein
MTKPINGKSENLSECDISRLLWTVEEVTGFVSLYYYDSDTSEFVSLFSQFNSDVSGVGDLMF